jgi:hypothetical protein
VSSDFDSFDKNSSGPKVPKIMKNRQKVAKRHFGGSPTVQKSTDSRKTVKNREKVNQKPIKKVTKKHQNGPKVCRKMPFWGSKKHGPGCQKASKSALFGHREGQKCQNPKNSKSRIKK